MSSSPKPKPDDAALATHCEILLGCKRIDKSQVPIVHAIASRLLELLPYAPRGEGRPRNTAGERVAILMADGRGFEKEPAISVVLRGEIERWEREGDTTKPKPT